MNDTFYCEYCGVRDGETERQYMLRKPVNPQLLEDADNVIRHRVSFTSKHMYLCEDCCDKQEPQFYYYYDSGYPVPKLEYRKAFRESMKYDTR